MNFKVHENKTKKKLERVVFNIFPQELPLKKHLEFSHTISLVSSLCYGRPGNKSK